MCNGCCEILIGEGELTRLWQKAKSTLIYSTYRKEGGWGGGGGLSGPVTEALQKMYCAVRGRWASTVSKNNRSQKRTIRKDLR